jgi:hypothetical protein
MVTEPDPRKGPGNRTPPTGGLIVTPRASAAAASSAAATLRKAADEMRSESGYSAVVGVEPVPPLPHTVVRRAAAAACSAKVWRQPASNIVPTAVM